MIVKVKNENGCWSYFEGDNVIWHRIKYGCDNPTPLPNNTIQFVFGNRDYILLCIQKENRVIARVLSNRSTYLMNDLGKTIDKLV